MLSWVSSLNFANPVWQTIVFWLWAFVALGGGLAVVGSLSSAVIQYYISDVAERKANIEIANSNTTASLAQRDAAKAKEVSDIAQQNIATLNAYIAELRLSRTLTETQIVAMSSALERFAGTNFTFAINPGDKESEDLLRILDDILTRARWNVVEWKGMGSRAARPGKLDSGFLSADNVVIRVHFSREFLYRTAIQFLADILTANGIVAVATQWNGFDPNEDVIQVIVGKKTPPPPPKLAALPPPTALLTPAP